MFLALISSSYDVASLKRCYYSNNQVGGDGRVDVDVSFAHC